MHHGVATHSCTAILPTQVEKVTGSTEYRGTFRTDVFILVTKRTQYKESVGLPTGVPNSLDALDSDYNYLFLDEKVA